MSLIIGCLLVAGQRDIWTGFGHVIIVDIIKVQQYVAGSLCNSLGGDLIEIESEKELTSLLPFVHSVDSELVWIAGKVADPERQHKFERNGVILTYFKWAPSQPQSISAKECIAMKLGEWYNRRCIRKHQFFCEYY